MVQLLMLNLNAGFLPRLFVALVAIYCGGIAYTICLVAPFFVLSPGTNAILSSSFFRKTSEHDSTATSCKSPFTRPPSAFKAPLPTDVKGGAPVWISVSPGHVELAFERQLSCRIPPGALLGGQLLLDILFGRISPFDGKIKPLWRNRSIFVDILEEPVCHLLVLVKPHVCPIPVATRR